MGTVMGGGVPRASPGAMIVTTWSRKLTPKEVEGVDAPPIPIGAVAGSRVLVTSPGWLGFGGGLWLSALRAQ